MDIVISETDSGLGTSIKRKLKIILMLSVGAYQEIPVKT